MGKTWVDPDKLATSGKAEAEARGGAAINAWQIIDLFAKVEKRGRRGNGTGTGALLPQMLFNLSASVWLICSSAASEYVKLR